MEGSVWKVLPVGSKTFGGRENTPNRRPLGATGQGSVLLSGGRGMESLPRRSRTLILHMCRVHRVDWQVCIPGFSHAGVVGASS